MGTTIGGSASVAEYTLGADALLASDLTPIGFTVSFGLALPAFPAEGHVFETVNIVIPLNERKDA